ncbi:hypothetical protein FOZ62_008650 [Perkinsus olseni]|uniref:Uncharacterized protein n=1 Tax=Perkinsus olseni TaxID=32597 RepID=A0A7J6NC07_PEROL|nr:hypothetical protein FOZ62_008650 [Perkinsus olseni]
MGAGGLGGLRDNRPNEPTEHGYCALVLSGKHDLYALKCPDVVKAAVRTSFGDIKSEGPSKKSTGLYKFTFGSSIWTGSGGKAEQAVVRLIDALREVGWYLEVDVGMSRTTFMQVWVLKKRDFQAHDKSCLLGLHDKADVRLVVHDTDGEGDRKADAVIKGISSTLKVEKEEDTPDGRLMKLAGRPFLAEEEGTVAVRQMVLAVSCELEKCYGNLVSRSVKLSNSQYSKSNLIFYSQAGDNQQQQQPKDTICVGVSLHDEDKIRIFTTPGDALTEDLGPSLEACLTEAWQYGIETKGVYGGSYQWQLKGSPWPLLVKRVRAHDSIRLQWEAL